MPGSAEREGGARRLVVIQRGDRSARSTVITQRDAGLPAPSGRARLRLEPAERRLRPRRLGRPGDRRSRAGAGRGPLRHATTGCCSGRRRATGQPRLRLRRRGAIGHRLAAGRLQRGRIRRPRRRRSRRGRHRRPRPARSSSCSAARTASRPSVRRTIRRPDDSCVGFGASCEPARERRPQRRPRGGRPRRARGPAGTRLVLQGTRCAGRSAASGSASSGTSRLAVADVDRRRDRGHRPGRPRESSRTGARSRRAAAR